MVIKLMSDEAAKCSSKNVGVLQVWSAKWSCYVDVSHLSEISEGNQVTVLVRDSTEKSSIEVQCTIDIC